MRSDAIDLVRRRDAGVVERAHDRALTDRRVGEALALERRVGRHERVDGVHAMHRRAEGRAPSAFAPSSPPSSRTDHTKITLWSSFAGSISSSARSSDVTPARSSIDRAVIRMSPTRAEHLKPVSGESDVHARVDERRGVERRTRR